MPRRQWVKFWTQEILYGTTLKELEPDERAVWFEIICAAGDSAIPGKVCVNERCGFTTEQLCELLGVSNELLQRALSTLETVGKIKNNGSNIIEVCNFIKYQGSDEAIVKHREYMKGYMRKSRKEKKGEKE